MARVHHVKKAQQRYKTVPVLDDNGEQKKVPVYTKRTDERGNRIQKQSKRGPVFRRLTMEDKSQPLPNRKCGKCGVEIKPGDPYKWVQPKSGPYGGSKRFRCAACPTWTRSELSSSKMATVYAAQEDYEGRSYESVEDLEQARDDLAQAINDTADEYEEAAQNIEGGFGHEVPMSEELKEKADSLREWAQEVEQIDFDEAPDCEVCDGTGHRQSDDGAELEECEACQSTGKATSDTEEFETWAEEQKSKLDDVAYNEP